MVQCVISPWHIDKSKPLIQAGFNLLEVDVDQTVVWQVVDLDFLAAIAEEGEIDQTAVVEGFGVTPWIDTVGICWSWL